MYGMVPRTQSPQATGSQGVTPQRTTASDIASLFFGANRGKGASPAEAPNMTTPQGWRVFDPPVTPRFAQIPPTRSGRTLVGQE